MNYMKLKGRQLLMAVFLGICSTYSYGAVAGDTTLLNVGDKMPQLKYDRWLKGTPIKGLEKGRLYIFEFWATWCGPCVMSMPHLSEVARKYKNNVTVVGIDIWENDESHHSKTDPARFVKQMGSNMDYNVATDTKDNWMGNNWMKASGNAGIPCSFMIKDSIILWIGHPINLDSVIDVVNSGKYDPVAVKAEFKAKASEEQEREAKTHAIMDPIDTAEKAGNYAKEYQLIQSGKMQMPELGGYLDFKWFMVLLDHYGEDSAKAFVKPWQATKPGFTGSTAEVILRKKGLSKDFYMYAVTLVDTLLANPEFPKFMAYEMKGRGYAAAGDYAKAVDFQEKALVAAKESSKDAKFSGFLTKDKIEGYEKELADYKSHL